MGSFLLQALRFFTFSTILASLTWTDLRGVRTTTRRELQHNYGPNPSFGVPFSSVEAALPCLGSRTGSHVYDNNDHDHGVSLPTPVGRSAFIWTTSLVSSMIWDKMSAVKYQPNEQSIREVCWRKGLVQLHQKRCQLWRYLSSVSHTDHRMSGCFAAKISQHHHKVTIHCTEMVPVHCIPMQSPASDVWSYLGQQCPIFPDCISGNSCFSGKATLPRNTARQLCCFKSPFEFSDLGVFGKLWWYSVTSCSNVTAPPFFLGAHDIPSSFVPIQVWSAGPNPEK